MLKRGKLRQCFWVVVLFLFGLSGFSAFAAHTGKDLAGTTLPGFKLGGTTSSNDQEYLGLKNSDPFVLSDVSAKVICIEVLGAF